MKLEQIEVEHIGADVLYDMESYLL